MLLRQFILIVIFSSQLTFLLLLPVISVTDDAEILLRTKNSHIEDPTGLLDDWIQTDNSPCNWTGIACDPLTSAVNIIDLAGFGVSGAFPADFCLIPTLQNLSLSDNFFNGSITTDLISSCSNLRYLNLSINLFVGDLPDFSSEFSNLSWLDLSRNNFSGEIPVCYGRFPNLQDLNLFGNLLNGTIPSFLSNLSELVRLDLGYNPFTPGPLPPEIGDLTKLEYLWLPFSNLVGEIPETFGKLFSLRKLDLSNNYLSGEIPNSIGLLKNIKQIELYSNRFSGELPESLGNLTTLISFDASQNNLTGKLPENLAGLGLTSLGLNDNYLEGEIPRTLALNPNLVQLMLFNNRLSGSLPVDLGRNSDMEDFDVSGNNLIGKLPPFLCYRKKLRRLIAFNNKLSGNLPESYGDCISLTYVRIFNNELSGTIPDHFWGLPNLYLLELKNNRFDGLIPPAISGSRELTQLIIFENQFSGELPKEICEMPELAVLDTSKNRLSGELPSCINKLGKLGKLHLEENMFSGMIPNNVSSWVYLTDLNLANNRFSGKIPSELGNLATLTYLDMSQNLLSGEIPAQLGNLKLNKFNVSSNNLSGKIPSGFDKSIYLPSLIGNPNLCSQNLKPFPPCPKTISSTPFLITVFICLAFLLLVSLFWFYKSKTKSIGGKTKPRWKLTSFYNMNFDEQEIFASLREENLIGTGSSGKVYMARLKTGQIVAVKRLCQGYEKTGRLCVHESEVDTLGRIRHGNIVKLLFSCIGENIRILVYEYMENGSLGDIIYAEKAGVLLDWHKRYKIAIGAAQGLAYLHHDCQPPIVHRDIKPNNILLDEEFFPRLADFGLAKALQDERSDDKNDMSCIAGSYGYIAPEYAYTMKVTEKSDVYSFGVVLMELITGKKPTDSSFGQNKDIVKWVGEAATASEDNFSSLHHLVDTKMHPSNSDYTEIEKVLDLSLLCTSAFPMNRPSMRKVVEFLKDIRKH